MPDWNILTPANYLGAMNVTDNSRLTKSGEITTSPCITECGVMTNYSGEGWCWWCAQMIFIEKEIEFLQDTIIPQIREARILYQRRKEEEE